MVPILAPPFGPGQCVRMPGQSPRLALKFSLSGSPARRYGAASSLPAVSGENRGSKAPIAVDRVRNHGRVHSSWVMRGSAADARSPALRLRPSCARSVVAFGSLSNCPRPAALAPLDRTLQLLAQEVGQTKKRE